LPVGIGQIFLKNCLSKYFEYVPIDLAIVPAYACSAESPINTPNNLTVATETEIQPNFIWQPILWGMLFTAFSRADSKIHITQAELLLKKLFYGYVIAEIVDDTAGFANLLKKRNSEVVIP
jgi:hypothetical protein